MMLAFCERLTNRKNFRDMAAADKNAYALKRGFAAGSLMDNVSDSSRGNIANKHVDDAVRILGIPAAFKRQPIPAALYRRAPNWLTVAREGEAE